MALPRFILVSGFLGAGKTSLLAAAATRLADRGKRVGLITNDQAVNLVDTSTLRDAGFSVGEVSGGCFCCKFDTLLQALDQLGDSVAPDYFLCEPVGSCTDLIATVVAPLRRYFADRYAIAPTTALVDPARLSRLTGPRGERPFPESVFYIFRKQLEDADCLLLSQADRHPRALVDILAEKLRAEFPGRNVQPLSTVTGEGLERWLDRVTGETATATLRPLQVDYERYAEGEALLGWLNARIRFESVSQEVCLQQASASFEWLMAALVAAKAEIAHAKAHVATPSRGLRLNLTDRHARLDRHEASGNPNLPPRTAQLDVNVRALTSPEILRALVEAEFSQRGGQEGLRVTVQSLDAFRPAAPEPVHRLDTTSDFTDTAVASS